MQKWCEDCGSYVNTRKGKRREIYPLASGAEVPILATVRLCRKCGADLFDMGLDTKNLNAAYKAERI